MIFESTFFKGVSWSGSFGSSAIFSAALNTGNDATFALAGVWPVPISSYS